MFVCKNCSVCAISVAYLICTFSLTKSNEIDFTDIFNYDPVLKKYDINVSKDINTEKLLEFGPPCLYYLKRYVNTILNIMNNSKCDHLNKNKFCQVSLIFNNEDQHFLKYSVNMEKYTDVDIIQIFDRLNSLLYKASETSNVHPKYCGFKSRIKDFLGVNLEMLIFILATCLFAFQVAIVFKRSFVQFIFKFSFALFLLSFPWTWYHLYQEALVKKHVEMSVPPECQNWWEEENDDENLFGFFAKYLKSLLYFPSSKKSYSQMSSKDKCLQYQRALKIDPFWEVPPSQAVVVTITKFILEPLHHLGAAFNALILQSFANFPIQYAFAVMCIVILISVFCMLMLFRYRLNLPFFLGALEPSPAEKIVKLKASTDSRKDVLNQRVLDELDYRYKLRNDYRYKTTTLTGRKTRLSKISENNNNVHYDQSRSKKSLKQSILAAFKYPITYFAPSKSSYVETLSVRDTSSSSRSPSPDMTGPDRHLLYQLGSGDYFTPPHAIYKHKKLNYNNNEDVSSKSKAAASTKKVLKRSSNSKNKIIGGSLHNLAIRRIQSVDSKVTSLVSLLKNQGTTSSAVKKQTQEFARHFMTLPDLRESFPDLSPSPRHSNNHPLSELVFPGDISVIGVKPGDMSANVQTTNTIYLTPPNRSAKSVHSPKDFKFQETLGEQLDTEVSQIFSKGQSKKLTKSKSKSKFGGSLPDIVT